MVSFYSLGSRAESDTVISRKLKEVGQAMGSMITQNNLVDSPNNPENTQVLDSLVEDICYALMDYQVCVPKTLALIAPDIFLRLHYDKISMTRAVKRL